jgi:predicted AAA+ superfamily ATPase
MHFFNDLLSLDLLAKKDGDSYNKKRSLFHSLVGKEGRHFIGIAGPRGSGKTVLLKQLRSILADSFYLSADTIQANQLFDVALHLSEKLKIKHILVDEIHFQKNFDASLKRIYDFLKVRVIFTSSVSLQLYDSAYDLSRRVEILSLSPFTFREFIFFKHDYNLPLLTLQDILDQHWSNDHLRFEFEFDSYLQGGLMPFALNEPDVSPLVQNILNTVITRDIPAVAKVLVDDLRSIENVVTFIGRSPSEDVNPLSISKNVGVTRYKVDIYLRLLKQAYILNPVLPAGTNVLKEPKVLMRLPYRLLFMPYQQAIGSLREDFFAEMMSICGKEISYLKSTRGEKTPDFLVRHESIDWIVEIGGRGKRREQFKNIVKSDKQNLILAQGSDLKTSQRPLFMLGYLA